MMTDPHSDRAHVRCGEPEASADHDLLLRMQVKDEAALETLYDRYAALVYALAMRIVGDRELALEVMQDTFLRCWNGAEQYDASRGRVAGWVMRVGRNRAIDLLRSRQHQARLRELEPLSEAGTAGPGQPDIAEGVVLRQVVSDALEALPTAQRQALELAYYGGLTQVEIAKTLDTPLGTVKTRTRQGLDRLRSLLSAWIEPEEAAGHRG